MKTKKDRLSEANNTSRDENDQYAANNALLHQQKRKLTLDRKMLTSRDQENRWINMPKDGPGQLHRH